jgi:hypothetical protein
MAAPSLQTSIAKLAMAGEQAGFTVEQMIWLLNAGVTIQGLLRLIEWNLADPIPEDGRSSPGNVNAAPNDAVLRNE